MLKAAWIRMQAALFVGTVRLVAAFLRSWPDRAADALGRGLGAAWYRLVPIRRGVARENVARAFAGLDPAAREAIVAGNFRHLGRSFIELLRASGRPAEWLVASGRVRIVGRERLEAALAEGRGALVLAAHLGNFELLVRLGALLGRPAAVVTRRFRWAPADRAWRALRRGGPALLPAGGSAREVLATLRANGVVAYVLDQHAPGRRAVRVPFFGRAASTSPDLVRLARLSRAPVVPVFIFRRDACHVVEIGAPVPLPRTANARDDVARGTAECTARIEEAVRRAPEQWLWIHRRWKSGHRPVGCRPREAAVSSAERR